MLRRKFLGLRFAVVQRIIPGSCGYKLARMVSDPFPLASVQAEPSQELLTHSPQHSSRIVRAKMKVLALLAITLVPVSILATDFTEYRITFECERSSHGTLCGHWCSTSSTGYDALNTHDPDGMSCSKTDSDPGVYQNAICYLKEKTYGIPSKCDREADSTCKNFLQHRCTGQPVFGLWLDLPVP